MIDSKTTADKGKESHNIPTPPTDIHHPTTITTPDPPKGETTHQETTLTKDTQEALLQENIVASVIVKGGIQNTYLQLAPNGKPSKTNNRKHFLCA